MDNTVIKIYRLWEIIYFSKKRILECISKFYFKQKVLHPVLKIIILVFFFFFFAIYNLLSLFTIANFSKILRVKEDKNFQLLLTLPLYVEHKWLDLIYSIVPTIEKSKWKIYFRKFKKKKQKESYYIYFK